MAERLAVIRTQPLAWLEWDGSVGGGADALRARYPRARRLVVEPDAAPGQALGDRAATPWWSPRRLARRGDVWLRADESPGLPVQLLWANMAVHRWPDPGALFARWRELLAVDGFLMFSTFGPDTLRELRTLYAREGWGPAHAPFVDMHDLGDLLVAAGFADPVMDQELITLKWTSADAALAELRGLGGNAHPDRFVGLRTPRWRARLAQALASGAGVTGGGVTLSFEVVYGHAFRVADKPRTGIRNTVSVDELRATLAPAGRPKGLG